MWNQILLALNALVIFVGKLGRAEDAGRLSRMSIGGSLCTQLGSGGGVT